MYNIHTFAMMYIMAREISVAMTGARQLDLDREPVCRGRCARRGASERSSFPKLLASSSPTGEKVPERIYEAIFESMGQLFILICLLACVLRAHMR